MKKFFKICGITILVLVIVGLVFFGIGAVSVGSETMNSLVEKLTKGKMHIDLNGIQVKDDLEIEIENVLDNNALYDIDDVDMFDRGYEIWKDDVEKTLVADSKVTKLEIELGGCMFELKDSGDSSYYVEYNGRGKSQVFVEEEELHIKAVNSNNWNIISWNENGNDNCLTLYVPMDIILEEVNIDLGAGQMKLDNLKTKDMEVDMGAGQILSDGLQAEKVSISVGAGEIVLDEVQVKDVQAEVGAGNCEIKGNVTGDIEAECAMGNMTFVLEGSEQDFNYEIQCVTGNITIGNSEYSGVSQEQSIHNNATRNMELECAMGNVEVEFE